MKNEAVKVGQTVVTGVGLCKKKNALKVQFCFQGGGALYCGSGDPQYIYSNVLIKCTSCQMSSWSGIFFLKLGISSLPCWVL